MRKIKLTSNNFHIVCFGIDSDIKTAHKTIEQHIQNKHTTSRLFSGQVITLTSGVHAIILQFDPYVPLHNSRHIDTNDSKILNKFGCTVLLAGSA